MGSKLKVLFFIGLFIETSAFFISQTNNFVFMQNILLPGLSDFKAGINTLEKKRELKPKNSGFTEIESIIISALEKQNNPELLKGISVTHIKKGDAAMVFSSDRAKEEIPLYISLSNSQTIKWDFAILKTNIEKFKAKNLFRYSLFIFVFGIIIQLLGFFFGNKNKLSSTS